MLLPELACRHPFPLTAIDIMREHDMPHGYFGDRDAGHPALGRRTPAACGLFGRLGGDLPPVPQNDGGPWRRLPDRPLPKERA